MAISSINYLETAKPAYFDRGNDLLKWLSFFMVTPVLLVGTNLSLYAFLYFYYYLYKTRQISLKLNKLISIIVILFGIGALTAVLSTLFKGLGEEYFSRGLSVLFNYWYWCFLIILLINLRDKINFLTLSQGIFWGIAFLIFYFFFLQNFLKPLPFFRGVQQNGFSFILICFVPLALYYLSQAGSKTRLYLFAIISTVAAFMSGSRTGSVLVMMSCIIFVFFYKKGIKLSYLLSAVFLVFLFFYLDLPTLFEDLVFQLNPRTHALLYSSKNIAETDISYLTRVAVLNKGLKIFNEHPLTGIGLNNFGAHDIRIDYNFKGAELIQHNDEYIRHISAHNSYVSILAETGLVGFIPFVLILGFNIISYLLKFTSWTALHLALFLGLIGMTVHFYFISAVLNVFAWFYIAIVSTCISLPTSSVFKQFNK